MIETEVPELDPDTWFEECPDCDGSGWDTMCLTCFDEGLVPHGHLHDAEVVLT